MLNNDLVKSLKIEAAQLNETARVVNILMTTKEYIDDHNRGDRVVDVTSGWVMVEYKGKLCPFPVNDRTGACLNPLYMGEDGEVHLSVWSIGPYYNSVDAVEAAGLPVHRFED